MPTRPGADVPTASDHEQLLDRFLDRSVVLGYSRIGYAIRSRRWPRDLSAGMLAGRRVLLTGGTSGIGKAAARRLAVLGAVVHIVGHDSQRAERALDDLRRAEPSAQFSAHVCDVADLDAVADFAESFQQQVPSLHALLHNAGTMAPTRTESPQGHELTLAAHVLGPFLLTRMLATNLVEDGRVVFMSSGGMYAQPIGIDDLQHHHDYNGTVAYARTKRMLVDLAPRWSRELPEQVTAHSMHPGWVDTPGVRTHLPRFRALSRPIMRTPAQGADTLVWLAAADRASRLGGRFWHDRQPRPTSYRGGHATSEADKERLWEFCTEAVGR